MSTDAGVGGLSSDWHPVGPATHRSCPLCTAWEMDEPPMEIKTEVTPDGDYRMRFRQQSAVPAGLMHIVTEHPESDQAAEILARVAEHRGSVTGS